MPETTQEQGNELLQLPNAEQDDQVVPRKSLAKTKVAVGTAAGTAIQITGTIKKTPPSSPFSDPNI